MRSSLDAVEQALRHFSASLDRAGFAQGADAYRQMADVVVGQWLWAEENGGRDLRPRFLRIAELAGVVADQLRPYVAAMDQVRGIRGLAAEAWPVAPDSLSERILAALVDAPVGLTATELRASTGGSTLATRRALGELVGGGLVASSGGSRARYRLAATPAPPVPS